jgi:hypothetical protein
MRRRLQRFIPKDYRPKNYQNVPEDLFSIEMMDEGWIVSKKGWPDFACWHPDGRFMAVEVKPPRGSLATLKREQERLMMELERFGIECFVWAPGHGAIPFRGYGRRRIKERLKPRPSRRFIPRGCLI